MMTAEAHFTIEQGAVAGPRLRLSGVLTVATMGAVDDALRQAAVESLGLVDLSGVSVIDTVGAWVVARTVRDSGARLVGASNQALRLIKAVSASRGDAPIVPSYASAFIRGPEAVGREVIATAVGTLGVLSFLGAMLETFGRALRQPQRFRGTALVRQIELVGVDSLAIVGLMSFLIGIVIAQQGAVQLQQFGAQIYTINLTGRLALRELGILMTAIMVAGRSGSAFAAEIGTMKLTEEIDAMRTIGVSPMEALVLPRVLASVLMMPLLGFYSAMIAIIGGATISALVLDIPFFTFLERIQEVVPMRDMWVGLIKGPVFGLIIAIAGCYQGMQAEGSSEEVGHRTTQAVVQAIFMVIVLDAFFAVFFTEVGWA